MNGLLFPQASEKLQRWSFSRDFGKHFVAAYNLQMWCFGCDIRRAAGNLLIEYGGSRHRAPKGSYGSSHYVLSVGAETQLHLLGFGVIVHGADSGLVLKRYDRIPRLATHLNVAPGIFEPRQLPQSAIPRRDGEIVTALQLLRLLAKELSRYEEFVRLSGGNDHIHMRQSTAPRALRQLQGVACSTHYHTDHRANLAGIWSGLAAHCRAALAASPYFSRSSLRSP